MGSKVLQKQKIDKERLKLIRRYNKICEQIIKLKEELFVIDNAIEMIDIKKTKTNIMNERG